MPYRCSAEACWRHSARQELHHLQVVRVLPHDVQLDLFSDVKQTSSTKTSRERELNLKKASHLPPDVLKNWLGSLGCDLNLSDAGFLTAAEWAKVVAALLRLDASHITSIYIKQPQGTEEASDVKKYLDQPLTSVKRCHILCIMKTCDTYMADMNMRTYLENLALLAAHAEGLTRLTVGFARLHLQDIVLLQRALAPLSDSLLELKIITGTASVNIASDSLVFQRW